MKYVRMRIAIESPEQMGYSTKELDLNLSEFAGRRKRPSIC